MVSDKHLQVVLRREGTEGGGRERERIRQTPRVIINTVAKKKIKLREVEGILKYSLATKRKTNEETKEMRGKIRVKLIFTLLLLLQERRGRKFSYNMKFYK